MKEGIHPAYGMSVIRCACGSVIETRGTRPEISVEVCSQCHPFFTGQQKLVDTAGRIDRFQKKYAGKMAVSKPKKKKAAPEPAKEPDRAAPPQA